MKIKVFNSKYILIDPADSDRWKSLVKGDLLVEADISSNQNRRYIIYQSVRSDYSHISEIFI